MLPYIPYIAHYLHHFFPSSCFLSFRVSCLAVLIRLRFAYQCLFLHLLFVSLFLFPQLFSNHCFFPPSPSFTSLLAAFLPFSRLSVTSSQHNWPGRGGRLETIITTGNTKGDTTLTLPNASSCLHLHNDGPRQSFPYFAIPYQDEKNQRERD